MEIRSISKNRVSTIHRVQVQQTVVEGWSDPLEVPWPLQPSAACNSFTLMTKTNYLLSSRNIFARILGKWRRRSGKHLTRWHCFCLLYNYYYNGSYWNLVRQIFSGISLIFFYCFSWNIFFLKFSFFSFGYKINPRKNLKR